MVSAESTGAIFGGHLEFPRKTLKHVYLGNGAISVKFLFRGVSAQSTGVFFPPLLAAILNFCVKRTNLFICHLEFLRKTHKPVYLGNRVISTNFLTHRLSAESTGDFSQKLFSRHFWWPAILNFCIKHSHTQKNKPVSSRKPCILS